jgi:hypothetical protein
VVKIGVTPSNRQDTVCYDKEKTGKNIIKTKLGNMKTINLNSLNCFRANGRTRMDLMDVSV